MTWICWSRKHHQQWQLLIHFPHGCRGPVQEFETQTTKEVAHTPLFCSTFVLFWSCPKIRRTLFYNLIIFSSRSSWPLLYIFLLILFTPSFCDIFVGSLREKTSSNDSKEFDFICVFLLPSHQLLLHSLWLHLFFYFPSPGIQSPLVEPRLEYLGQKLWMKFLEQGFHELSPCCIRMVPFPPKLPTESTTCQSLYNLL